MKAINVYDIRCHMRHCLLSLKRKRRSGKLSTFRQLKQFEAQTAKRNLKLNDQINVLVCYYARHI